MEEVSFADLDDFDSQPKNAPRPGKRFYAPGVLESDVAAAISMGGNRSIATIARYPCSKCRGSGKFIGYTGRIVGDCRQCRGTGKQKTDPELAQRKRQAKAEALKLERAAMKDRWATANPEAWQWIEANKATFSFASSLAKALDQWGSLTDGQLKGVFKCIEAGKRRQQERAGRQPDALMQGAGFTKMLEAFDTAKRSLLNFPSLRIGAYKFSLACQHSVNANCIYVKRGQLYVGKITKDGKFFASRDASEEDIAKIKEIGADPFEALVAHGKQTGYCGCCGRLLENPESVRLGIGPICRGKWGL